MRGSRVWAALLLAGCAARGASPPLSPAVRDLAAEMDSVFGTPEFARAQWGVVVRSLDNGQVLYRRNAQQLFMPASNQKILTGAVSLARLGGDFRWTTFVLGGGPRRGDTLAGDLIVVGRGDPTFSLRSTGTTDPLASLRPWADSLRARGVRVVAGRVVADATFFPDAPLGEGWMWDDLQDSYSAPVGALLFNEGFALVRVAAGDTAGAPARVWLDPSDAPLTAFSTVRTVSRDSAAARVRWNRPFFTDSVPVWGGIPVGRAPLAFEVAVRDPALYFVRALNQVLREAGIVVLGTGDGGRGTASVYSPLSPVPSPESLFTWRSRPLREVLPLLEKPSQNQIAEMLLRTLGSLRGVASVDSGRAVVRETLNGWGIPEDAYVFADGSGLSRYNYVAPDAIAQTLFAIAHHPEFDAFYQSLPIAGVDGTIANRMRGTAAQGNVHAKTGTISNVRSLSGYVTTADGEKLLFVLMANHFTVSSAVAGRVQDHVAERLANFRRATPRR